MHPACPESRGADLAQPGSAIAASCWLGQPERPTYASERLAAYARRSNSGLPRLIASDKCLHRERSRSADACNRTFFRARRPKRYRPPDQALIEPNRREQCGNFRRSESDSSPCLRRRCRTWAVDRSRAQSRALQRSTSALCRKAAACSPTAAAVVQPARSGPLAVAITRRGPAQPEQARSRAGGARCAAVLRIRRGRCARS